MKLLVVIVCYKVVDLTIDCLAALEPEVAESPGTKVALCENGTGPDAVGQLERAILDNGWSSWVELTSVMPNRGFTGGNNSVIAPALARDDPPEYVLLLNADTEVRVGALKALVEFMDSHPRVGVAGSQLLSPDGSTSQSAFKFEGIATQLNRGLRLGLVTRLLRPWVRPRSQSGAAPADWVSGASMIVRREVLSKLGGLDEGFYTYFDDIDLCLNTWRSGWEVWHVPQSRVMHLEGASTGIKGAKSGDAPRRRPTYWFQARRRYFLKNYGAFYAACVDMAFIAGQVLWRLRRVIQRRPDVDPPSLLMDSIRHSVFLTGFKLRAVENPAMKRAVAPAMVGNAIEGRS